MPTNDRGRNGGEYNSRLKDWDSSAGVRAKPRRLLTDEESMGKVYFSTALVPIIHHPLVVGMGPEVQRRLLIQHLYHYLDFTTNFEIEVVNHAARRIAFGKAGFRLPDAMLFDAYKVYCDEGFHSFFSVDIKQQVEAATGVAPLPYNFREFLGRLNEARKGVPENLKQVSALLMVIVFETLISSILNKIPKDKQVISAVREMVSDHADDEARHHSFFSNLFDIIWPQLSEKQHSILGPLLPHFIIKSLEPDYNAIRRRLASCGLAPADVEQVIDGSYPHEEVIAALRKTASATLRLFERNGLFKDARTLDAFHRSELLP
jgi:hypothetical protein